MIMEAYPTLAVIIPAFNEASRIEATLGELCGYLRSREWDWEIRVVDDGSSDDTSRLVERCARTEPRVRLQQEPHRGKGGAVRAGFLATRAAYRFLCDADLSMPAREIGRFMPPSLDADVAIGTREGAGARRIGEPLLRHLVGRGFNALVRLALVADFSDTQCGFKMFTGPAADAIFPHVTVEGWAFDLEVLSIARLRGLRIDEVPIEWHYREESRVSLVRDSVGMATELLRIRARIRRGAYGR
ncbi:MAG TPA: dolichyl-phosphate beta-glucosyltransferase [Vicinamibacterales bacterium]|nr:dolichyl-phosphate beta-glucosyltransferase [Vicinamibacterales bacterium]